MRSPIQPARRSSLRWLETCLTDNVASMVIPIDRFKQTQNRKPIVNQPPKGRPDGDPPPASQALAA